MLKLAGKLSDGQLADHIANLDAHTYNWMQVLRAGEYITPIPIASTSTSVSVATDAICAVPFIVARAMTIDRIAINTTTAKAGKIARLGIYNNGTDNYPGTLLLDAGTVDLSSAGILAAVINQSLTKGLYWLVYVANDNPTICMGYPAFTFIGMGTGSFITSNFKGSWYKAGVGSGALADPFVSGAITATTSVPLVSPRIASLD
jgi:hypothetical protein